MTSPTVSELVRPCASAESTTGTRRRHTPDARVSGRGARRRIPRACDAAATEARNALESRIAQDLQRSRPSLLQADPPAEDTLAPEAAIASALIIVFGGVGAIESVVLNALCLLLINPAELRELLRPPSLTARGERGPPAASARDDARAVRHAGRPEGGAEIRRGERVTIFLGAVNRDSAFFDDPRAVRRVPPDRSGVRVPRLSARARSIPRGRFRKL